MSQSAQCLACKLEDLSLIPQTNTKEQSVVEHTCNTSTGKMEMADPQNSLAGHLNQISEFQVLLRDPVSKKPCGGQQDGSAGKGNQFPGPKCSRKELTDRNCPAVHILTLTNNRNNNNRHGGICLLSLSLENKRQVDRLSLKPDWSM